MATSVGLNFRLTAAVDKFEASMRDVDKRLRGIEGSSVKTAKGMKLLAGIEIGRTVIKSVAKLFNVFQTGVSAVTGFVGAASNAADAVGKLSSSTGMAHEPLQVFQKLAEDNGISGDKLGEAVKRMTKRLAEAKMGFGEALPALERLGLNVEELASMRPEQAFIKIGAAIGDLPQKGDQAAAAFKIFSDQGLAMVPMFADLEANVKDTADEMLSLGQILSGTQIKNIEAMNDAFADVKRTAFQIGTQVLANFAPALTEANEELIKLIQSFEYNGAKGGQAIANMLSEALLKGAELLLIWYEKISNIFITFASALMKVAELFLKFVANLASVADTIYATLAPITRAFTGGIDVGEDTIADIRALAESAGAAADELWETKADFSSWREMLDRMRNGVKDAAADVDLFGVKTAASADTMAGWMEGSFDAQTAMGDLANSVRDSAGTVPIDLAEHGRAAEEAARKARSGAIAMDLLTKASNAASGVLTFLQDPTSSVAGGMEWLLGHVQDVASAAGFTEDRLRELANAAKIAKNFRTDLFDSHMSAWDRQATMVRDRLIANGMNAFDANYMMMQARNKEIQRVNGILDAEHAKHLKNVAGLTVNTENAGKAIAEAGKVLGNKLSGAAKTAVEWATGLSKDASEWFGGLLGGGDAAEGPDMPEPEQTLPELAKQTIALDGILAATQNFGSNFTKATFV